MTDVVIVSAARTPIGSFNGSLAALTGAELGKIAVSAAIERAGVAPADVTEVILGQILTAGTGQNGARQALIKAGLPIEVPAITINQVCGSGLRAVAQAFDCIRANNGEGIIIAGGQESMSNAPHTVFLRGGVKMGAAQLVDSMINDGLTDAFGGYHMGVTAENIAKQFNISREEQDAFAAASQQKAEAAMTSGKFKEEIVPVTIKGRKGDVVVDTDEFPKAGVTAEALGKLKAAFDKAGSVTAGNASGINDGAAAMVVMSAEEAAKRGLTPLARIVSWAQAGVDPSIMGTGPIPASKLALKKAGWSVDDLDLIEANEAFAVQAISVNQGMGWDVSKVNVNGGAISLGHPVGASGARILVTLLHEMKRRDAKKGLATLCIGGGMGIALCVERA